MSNQDIQNNSNIWFKRKTYGWGWVPSTWQGWGVIVLYVFSLVNNFLFVDFNYHSVSDTLLTFLPNVYISTIFLLIICYAKGEEPHWQWGEDKKE